jgi:pyruvate/2-oxoglutarate dehydrogenase complex dihydrolipoamide acyltransferase (E2) component
MWQRTLIVIAVMAPGVSAAGHVLQASQASQPSQPSQASPPRAAQPAKQSQPSPRQSPQEKRATTSPEPTPAAAPEKRRAGQPINVKVEAIISDQRGSAAPVKKTLTLVVGDGLDGMVRSDSQFPSGAIGTIPLHMDAWPEILPDGKIRVRFGLQYDLPHPAGADPGGAAPGALNPNKTAIQERLTLILENGKSIVATQSADPVSDRQVTVEVKATILK